MNRPLATPASTPPAMPSIPPTQYAHLIEDYTPERIAEFLLNNAVGKDGYADACEEVRKLGIDPATVPHQPPPGA